LQIENFQFKIFGVGWYVPEPEPAVFVSTTPAWNNRNLRYNAFKVRSHCFFAHVRAASVGDVSEAHCHPFHYQQFLFMHNGGIGGFSTIKRTLRNRLSDELYNWIRGQTDSEHFFALFLNNLGNRQERTRCDGSARRDDCRDQGAYAPARHQRANPSQRRSHRCAGRLAYRAAKSPRAREPKSLRRSFAHHSLKEA
jgi:predicted glutamine amidotransferase